MLGIHAEDDGLLPAVTALLEEVRYPPGDAPGALVNDQVTVKIFLVVETVFDLVALLVGFARTGAVALHIHIHIQMHLDDLVWGQETVADALLERRGGDRCAKVVDVGNVGGFSGRGGQADLRRCSKIIQNFSPGRILSGAAAVALVDHDQIKKAWGELAKELLPLFWS